ncbi:hypothetical protein M422DRAFT_213808, partial [Sphaerobolus stellatus SS14]
MPRGYDALRDVLASGKAPNSPTLLRPHIQNILNDPIPGPPPQPTMPKPVPYNPTRISEPKSVLIPLTPEELESFKIPRHALRMRLNRVDPSLENPNFFPPNMRDKRKRDESDQPRGVKRSRDSGLVAQHYNSRPDVGVTERRDSPIIGLKNFNNWVKSVLIAKFSREAFEASMVHQGRMRGKVLDMGCGKGGDLQKWQKALVKEYVGLDIADVSVQQARGRWSTLKGNRFLAFFAALDCYTEHIERAITPAMLTTPFDVVSMQFCMHYAFDTLAKVRMMFENVTKFLRPGGIFLGTVPNAEYLMGRMSEIPPSAPPEFGNSVYKIRFEHHLGAQIPTYGHRYWFFLRDAVEDVPEYVVHWQPFVALAKEYGLNIIYKREFGEVFADEREHPEYGPLLRRMKVVNADGVSDVDEEQWEAANIYVAFAFRKR